MGRFRTQALPLLLAGAGVVVAVASGYGLLALLLACPLMMIFMHRGMSHDGKQTAPEEQRHGH